MPEDADSDRWQQELIARAEGEGLVDPSPTSQCSSKCPSSVLDTGCSPKTRIGTFLYAIVTPAAAADLHLHDDWLLDALHRVG